MILCFNLYFCRYQPHFEMVFTWFKLGRITTCKKSSISKFQSVTKMVIGQLVPGQLHPEHANIFKYFLVYTLVFADGVKSNMSKC
jgi:hypothetical protein